jgi:hypothetical protein
MNFIERHKGFIHLCWMWKNITISCAGLWRIWENIIKVWASYPTILTRDKNIVIVINCACLWRFLKRHEKIVIYQHVSCSVTSTGIRGWPEHYPIVSWHFEFHLKKFILSWADMLANLMPMCHVGHQDDIILYFGSQKSFFSVNLTCGTNMIYSCHISKIQ